MTGDADAAAVRFLRGLNAERDAATDKLTMLGCNAMWVPVVAGIVIAIVAAGFSWWILGGLAGGILAAIGLMALVAAYVQARNRAALEVALDGSGHARADLLRVARANLEQICIERGKPGMLVSILVALGEPSDAAVERVGKLVPPEPTAPPPAPAADPASAMRDLRRINRDIERIREEMSAGRGSVHEHKRRLAELIDEIGVAADGVTGKTPEIGAAPADPAPAPAPVPAAATAPAASVEIDLPALPHVACFAFALGDDDDATRKVDALAAALPSAEILLCEPAPGADVDAQLVVAAFAGAAGVARLRERGTVDGPFEKSWLASARAGGYRVRSRRDAS